MYLDIENWNRRDTFHFFKTYDNPFFNIVADVDVTRLREYVRRHELSFFITSLYLTNRTANDIENFRYRIQGDKIRVYESVYAGSTVLNEDDTFGFCYFPYQDSFREYYRVGVAALADYRSGRSFDPRDDADDVLHYSVIPWVSFRSFSHARKYNSADSVPKLVMGKYREDAGRLQMPLSVEVHHSLMDGVHVGRYFQKLQAYLDDPETVLDV